MHKLYIECKLMLQKMNVFKYTHFLIYILNTLHTPASLSVRWRSSSNVLTMQTDLELGLSD